MKIQLRLKSINLAKGILKALTKHQVGNKIEFKLQVDLNDDKKQRR